MKAHCAQLTLSGHPVRQGLLSSARLVCSRLCADTLVAVVTPGCRGGNWTLLSLSSWGHKAGKACVTDRACVTNLILCSPWASGVAVQWTVALSDIPKPGIQTLAQLCSWGMLLPSEPLCSFEKREFRMTPVRDHTCQPLSPTSQR